VSSFHLKIGIALVFVAALLFGILAFKSCYDDHRNELGFSRLSSVTSCAG
jgi:hypothetical protein